MKDESRTYTVGQLAQMSGASVRALHHYEEKGLLSPKRTANGYRAYSPADVARLQQIMLYRACGLELSHIRKIMQAPDFDARQALYEHLDDLRCRKRQIEELISTVEKTIDALEGATEMTDEERFEGLKRAAIEENERTFGAEARARHGDAAIDAANAKRAALDESEWKRMEDLEQAIIDQLKTAAATGNPSGPEAARLADLHAQWIRMQWGDGTYSRDAHRGLAQGYLADERFRDYYDSRAGAGATEFLVAALTANLS